MTIHIQSLQDLDLLAESVDLECKLAQGANGDGEVPKDFWPTYSAMANAHGGIVLLGIKEKNGVFQLAGFHSSHKVRSDLFNTLNNPAKVSTNLLDDSHVKEVSINGKKILQITIPAASRKEKPIYLNGQPLGNTWLRLNDGDRRCSDETVKRMLAEQVEDERDARILPHFGLDDINSESLRIYRQMLRDEKPGHPYLEQSDRNFLISLRGWRQDRQTNESGLTIAGLLMFGKWSSIQEAMPLYFLDYQERPEAKTEARWIDRVVPDGTWSGNLFDFYRRVYRKLIADLKVPFALKDGQRQDDTPVHEALREALVNTLVHADYSGRLSVLVVKRPDMFGFRNPGGLRLPIEQVLRGGESDCRNRILHQMFLLIGLGERGGSGVPKIYSGWESQHWRPPALEEKLEPEQTLLLLQMADLLPEPVLTQLKNLFGKKFEALDYTGRLVMATAAMEKVVSHKRLQDICGVHSHDLSLLLSRLVKQRLLESDGKSRGTVYFLPGAILPTPEQIFLETNDPERPNGNNNIRSSSEYTELSSEYFKGSSEHRKDQGEERDEFGRLLTDHLDAPIIDSLPTLEAEFRAELEILAIEPRQKQRLGQEQMEAVILALCKEQFLTLSVLSQILHRNPDGLRQQHLSRMVRAGKMTLAFPTKPTHEKQAYRATDHKLHEHRNNNA